MLKHVTATMAVLVTLVAFPRMGFVVLLYYFILGLEVMAISDSMALILLLHYYDQRLSMKVMVQHSYSLQIKLMKNKDKHY